MNKKIISLIISLVLTSSLSLNVKATEQVESPGQNLPVATEGNNVSKPSDKVTPESETNDSSTLELDSLDLPKQFDFVVGDEFKERTLKESLNLDESLLLTIISPIKDGVVTKKLIGTHVIFINIEDRLGNKIEHQANLVITGKPVITIGRNTINRDDIFTLDLIAPKAYDNEDGDISRNVKLLASQVNVGKRIHSTEITSFTIVLGVTDRHNNETTMQTQIYISEDDVTPMALNSTQTNITKTIAGTDRYKTAAAISKEMYSTTNTAILVFSGDFPDALAAGPLAISMNAPILLTRKDNLSSDTKAELTRLGVKKVILMGGESALSKDIEIELAKMTPSISVERIFGEDRYKTAIVAAQKLTNPSKVFLTNGLDFADAMTAGSYASSNGYPIVLTKNAVITPETRDYLLKSTAEIVIVGGTSAVSSNIEAELKKEGKTVSRIQGTNRYTTALDMAKKFFPKSTISVVASGMNFVDALTAVPYAASMNAPIMLTKKDNVDSDITDYLIESTLANFHFIGGNVVISDNVKSSIIYPSLYEVSYQTADLSGNWSARSKNGQMVGSPSSNGFSQFYIETIGDKDISIRYGAYVTGIGWQNISDSTEVGVKGKTIDSLIMELNGSDANKFDIFYRSYSKNTGWTDWTLGGTPVGIPGGNPILAVESRIIKGNANKIDKSLFPKFAKKNTYSFTKSSLNLRAQEDSKSKVLLVMPQGSNLDVVSVNPKTNWGKINFTAKGVVHTGYASMAYIGQDSLVSNAILTVNGLKNGDGIPTKDIVISGDAAYRKGINTLTYHINGIQVGTADYGYLTSGGINYGFDTPAKTGYKFTIPVKSWIPSKINSLKVEILGNDGTREWETIYIGGNSKETVVTEKYNASFNYFMNKQLTNGSAHYNNSVPSVEILTKYMDPSAWIAHDTYKYMFLDLGYSPSDYSVTAKQIDDIIKGKGVLNGMGSTFLKAAEDFNINPFYLVAHAILETGHGKSVLANGQKFTHYHEKFGDPESALIPISSEYVDKYWYNMFGIGAYNRNANLWGGEKAYHEGWDTVEKAIYGGAKWISSGYIDRSPEPQNTNYKMRYNLKETMTHQYATDIMWAYKQASNIKKQFDAMGVEVPLRFIVPTFDDVRP